MNHYIQDGRYGMGDRMGEGVAPSMLIKDCSVVGCADRGTVVDEFFLEKFCQKHTVFFE